MARNASPLRKGGIKGGWTAPAHGQKIRPWRASDPTNPNPKRERGANPSREGEVVVRVAHESFLPVEG